MAYYITDILWGFLASFKIKTFAYIDTQIYFAVIVLSVFLWGRYVIAYLEEKNLFTRIPYYTSLTIFILVLVVLVINLFIPIVFNKTNIIGKIIITAVILFKKAEMKNINKPNNKKAI